MIRALPLVVVAPLFLLPLVAALSLAAASGASVPVMGPAVLASLRFSLLEALASAAASLALGLPGAILLGRYRFPLRRAYAGLGGIPFVFPAVLFTLGFLRFWGNNGLFNGALRAILGDGAGGLSLVYSFWGIVAAHALMNFPLIIGLVSSSARRIGGLEAQAARTLGAREGRVFLTVTLPAVLPGIAAATVLVFLYCFMSFAVPLTLGGGPASSTLEVSIYAAISGSQDFARAGFIAMIELLCAVSILGLYAFFSLRLRPPLRTWAEEPKTLSSLRPATRLLASLYLILSTIFALTPIVGLLVSSFTTTPRLGGKAGPGIETWARLVTTPSLRQAALDSLLLALAVGLIALLIALVLVSGETRKAGVRAVFFALPAAISSIILSLGYLVLFPLGAGFLVLALVQATAAYPLAYRNLAAAKESIQPDLRHAAALLGAGRRRIFMTIDAPILKPAIMVSFALCAAVSLGEINAALMLGPSDFPLLGLQAYRLMASYQYPLACAIGVVIAAFASFAFASAHGLSEE